MSDVMCHTIYCWYPKHSGLREVRDSLMAFDHEIATLLSAGWEPVGSPTVVSTDTVIERTLTLVRMTDYDEEDIS